MRFIQFLEARVHVPKGQGQVTPEIKAAVMDLLKQGVFSPKEIHKRITDLGFKVTYAALYGSIRYTIDDAKRAARQPAPEPPPPAPVPAPPLKELPPQRSLRDFRTAHQARLADPTRKDTPPAEPTRSVSNLIQQMATADRMNKSPYVVPSRLDAIRAAMADDTPKTVDPYMKKQLDEPDNFHLYRPGDDDEDDSEALPAPSFGHSTGGGIRINRSSKIYS
jgi:hypothetical protein